MAFRRLGLPLGPRQEQGVPAKEPSTPKAPKAKVLRGALQPAGAAIKPDLAPSLPSLPSLPSPSQPRAANGSRRSVLVAASALQAKPARTAKAQLRARQEVDAVAVDAVDAVDGAKVVTSKVRGRNLLGSVLTHLGSARKRLQLDTAKGAGAGASAAPRRPVVKSIVKPKLQVKVKPKMVEEKPISNSNELLEVRLAEHYSHMMNFIRTRVEPILFYLPAKHNAETQQCLQETQRTIRRKIEMLPTHLGGGLEDDEAEKEGED